MLGDNLQVSPHFDWIIIGAGAAGLFAAARAEGASVLVLERGTRAGRKMKISGAGQCNFTHAEGVSDMSGHYGDKKNFVRHALGKLDPNRLMDFFERIGVPSVVREDGKVFPASLKAEDLIEALLQTARAHGVRFEFNQKAESILPMVSGGFEVACQGEVFHGRRILLACGGSSYPMTGSDGSGLLFAESLGLETIPPRPSLSPVYHQDGALHGLAGVVLTQAQYRYKDPGGVRAFKGDVLFTHTGLSGPGILNASRWMKAGGVIELSFSGMDSASFEASLLEASARQGTKQFKTVLRALIGTRSISELIEAMLGETAVQTNMASVSKAMRQQAVKLATAYEVKLTAIGDLRSAMATAGGVSTKEVVARTMMVKRIPGLYLAGEVVDVDGDTGGYNLHWAFASADLALTSAKETENKER